MDDVDNYYKQWDDKVRSALVLFHEVDQPLLPLVDEHTYKRVQAFLNDQGDYESVRNLKMASVNHH
jgi:uncharacterized protein